uniref:Uncharacterized protein Dryg n=1 Tax=Dugesia ryukyuensis TaxID=79738 RepID=Q868D5_DUGRY|nr:hypothetical protein [Dugesia ryukyuensis]
MLLILGSILLLSIIQIQGHDYHNYYEHYCDGNYYTSPTKFYFCHYLKTTTESETVPFPTISECKTCKELLKRITWNSHSEKAVENLLDYTTKHFCENVKRSTKVECQSKLNEYKPKMKEFLVKIMKNGKFCEVLLKCAEKKDVLFTTYFTEYTTDWTDFYSMPFFEYFFNRENYSEDFYPYHFFNYFYHYQDNEHPTYYHQYFYETPHTENHMFPHEYFQYFYKNKTTNYFPHQFFHEYFFNNQYTSPTFNHNNFYDYFFTDEYHGFFERDQKPSEKFCNRCENIPESKFLKWAKSVDIKMLTDAGYKVMCSELNTTESERCREIISHIGTVILHELENVLSVKNVCYKIYRCPMNLETTNEMHSFYYDTFDFTRQTSKRCEVCKAFSDVFSSGIDRDLFEEMVVDQFEKVYCNKLFPKKEHMCKKFLKNELPNILNKLRVSIHRDYLCNSTCNGKLSKDWIVSFTEHFFTNEDKKCPACKYVSKILKSLIRSSGFKAAVIRSFQQTQCKTLFLATKECVNFIFREYNGIVKNMTTTIEENRLCRPYCNKKDNIVILPWTQYFDKSQSSCELCEDLIDDLEELNPSLTTIESDLERLCKSRTGTENQYCTSLLAQYKTQIKTLIINNRPKDEICRTINQCFTNPKFYGIFESYFL